MKRHLFALLLGSASIVSAENAPLEEGFHSLFNGRNLDGWTIKIAKHPLGENYNDTIRVEDGIIKVSYDKYTTFNDQFGHLYSNSGYGSYILRLEYRITGTAVADAPKWAKLNSGVMLHSQSPLTLGLDQSFPVSLEAQFLVEGTEAGTQTGNACTPGTDVEVNGARTKDHIIDSKGTLSRVDEWVQFEVEVHGHEEVIHRVNGVEVLRYKHPVLDETDKDAQRLLAAGVSPKLSFGHIALQAESQPVWFRNIRIKPLAE